MKRLAVLFFLCIVCRQLAMAQLCTGSLGDPIVNFTFGNTSTPLKAGVTNMQFTALACPNDGQYTITNRTTGCFNNTWHTVNGDHTGDAGGQFMLINASITPDDFYVDTVRGLCGNTTFEFAAWIANVQIGSACNFNPIRPNLTFRIETTSGTVLTQYNTGDINSTFTAQWNQYGTFFKTPAGISTVVLRITNNASGGCGNDLALDDITFRPCGPLVQTTIRNQPSTDISVCDNNKTSFTLDVNTPGGFTGMTIQWQKSVDSGKTWTDLAGENGTSYLRPSTGTGVYYYRAVVAETTNFSSAQCRVASTTASITVNKSPVFPTRQTVTGCLGSDLYLRTDTASNYSYQWTGPNQFSSTQAVPVIVKVKYADSGLYKVTVTTTAGCSGRDSFTVKVYPGVIASVIPASSMVCEGSSINLLASGGTGYSWYPVTGLSNTSVANPVASPLDTTIYKVTVTNQYGCSDSAQTTVNVYQKPVVSAGADKKIFEGNSTTLDGSISGNQAGFFWTPTTAMSSATSLIPTVSPTDSLTYRLVVDPGMGCAVVSDDVFVLVYKKLFVPNVFTPNGDGINDTWAIRGLGTYPGAIVRVYSRTGALVYQGNNSPAWDGSYQGKPVPVAVYYYVVDLNAGLPAVAGWVMVIR